MKLHKGSEREESEEEEEEEDYISDLLLPLKTNPGEKEFETVEEILKMREEKLRMEKEESKKHVIHLVEDLGVYHSRCNELWNELERKKREISRVEGKLEVVCGRQKVFEERIRDLECAKTRAENEIEFWKKMFKQLETRVLVEPQVLRNLYVEPRDEEGLNGRESVVRGETVSGVMVKIKEEATNYGGRGYGYTGVDNPSTKQIAMPELAGITIQEYFILLVELILHRCSIHI
ncbi:hypothetical protein ACHQM5_010862 [Ranunculus cassubicifolius]